MSFLAKKLPRILRGGAFDCQGALFFTPHFQYRRRQKGYGGYAKDDPDDELAVSQAEVFHDKKREPERAQYRAAEGKRDEPFYAAVFEEDMEALLGCQMNG